MTESARGDSFSVKCRHTEHATGAAKPVLYGRVNRTLITACTGITLLALLAGCNRGSKPTRVNYTAPDFAVTDSDRSIALRDFRGKVVVLNFWATWCPPCVQEMPSLTAMQARLRDRVSVVAISVDEDPDTYHRFLRENKIELLTVRDPERKSSQLYGSSKYPETYIIDRSGILRRKFIGPVEWTSPEILEYLNKL
jgi:peroxiredoxin